MDLGSRIAEPLARSLRHEMLHVSVEHVPEREEDHYFRYEIDVDNLEPVMVELSTLEVIESNGDDQRKVQLLRHKFYEQLARGEFGRA